MAIGNPLLIEVLMGKTSTNKGLSVATFDYRMVYYSSWVSSLNSITSVFVGVFWCSCLKTLSLAPSLPLQALLLLLELVHLCPLRAEFRIAVALSIWSIIQYIQHHPELPPISADPCRQQGERVREELIKG